MASKIRKIKIFLLCAVLMWLGFLWTSHSNPFLGVDVAKYPLASNFRYSNRSEPQGSYNPSDLLLSSQTENVQDNTETIQDGRTWVNSSSRKCSEKKFDVSFLKVHKAGSTTLMNIFLRFAIEHKLNIVLPRKSEGNGFNYLGYGKTVTRENIVPLPANEYYNILCNHVVYNKEAFRSILPDDTVYVGIIREPVSHFISASLYYGFYKQLRDSANGRVSPERVVSEFLENPSQRSLSTYFVHNRMCYDFGIPKEKFHDDTYVDAYIEELSRDYSLVLVLEHFQESLVLMKRELCWETKDILYVPLNAMRNKQHFDVDSRDIKNLKKWNSADFKLYGYFYKEFNAKIALHGEDLNEEVQSFKLIQEEVKMFCNKIGRSDTTSVLTVPKTKWGNSFTVAVKDCKLMMESELPMMKRLIEHAWARYNASVA